LFDSKKEFFPELFPGPADCPPTRPFDEDSSATRTLPKVPVWQDQKGAAAHRILEHRIVKRRRDITLIGTDSEQADNSG
jgi:hypothetical protein